MATAAGMTDADAVSIGRVGLVSRWMARVRADDDIVWIKYDARYADIHCQYVFLGMQLMRACAA